LKTMPRTIKVSGFSDELLALVERRWPRHYGDRSEYIRDLVRKDVLADRRKSLPADPTFGFAVVRESMKDEAQEPAPAELERPKRTPRRRSLPMLG